MRGLLVLLFLPFSTIIGAQSFRWNLTKNGSIQWAVKKDEPSHTDHIEMSGKKVSFILTYGTDSAGGLILKKTIVFPMLRTIPNDTHASLIKELDESRRAPVLLNGKT